jgi:hypothetical protein
VEVAADAADDDLNGAEPGSLGQALHGAGLTTGAYGSELAIVALMDRDGCVDVASTDVPAGLAEDVTSVDLRGLEIAAPAAARLATLLDIDAAIGELPLPADAFVMVVAPSAPDDAADVTVTAIVPPGDAARRGDESGEWALLSASTRRSGYVTLADLAPTILSVVGGEVPESMNGTPVTRTRSDAADLQERVAELADAADLTEFRDRAIGPVSVAFIVFLVVCGVAGLGGRARLARMLAPFVVSIPTVAFLSGLVDYHRLPLDFYVVAVLAVAAVFAALATASYSRWGGWAPTTALAGLLWLVLIVDIATGGHLQINTPLGYSATSAGRFQGFGNLAFALLSGSALAVAVVPVLLGLSRAAAALWAATIGCVTLVGVAAPAFGSDVGGTLALVPTFIVVVLLIGGHRVGWRRAVLAGVASVAVLCGVAAIDLARDAGSRTHLGRFAQKVLDGDAGLIVRRKIQGNLDILFATFWSFVLVALFAGGAVLWWRSRERFAAYLADRPAVRAFLIGFVIVAFLGSALNDSGIVIFGIMCGVMVPFLVAVTIAPVPRAGRG